MTRYRNRFTLVEALIGISIILIVISITVPTSIFMGWSNEAKTVEVLEANGYTGIEITGWRPWMANENDWYSTGFRATAPNGRRVSGAVTGGGWFRGYTVRLD